MKILYHPSCLLPREQGEDLCRLPIYFNFEFYLLYIHESAYPEQCNRSGDAFMEMISDVINIPNYSCNGYIYGANAGLGDNGQYYVPLFIEGRIKNNSIWYTKDVFLNRKPLVMPDITPESNYYHDHLQDWFFGLYHSVKYAIELCIDQQKGRAITDEINRKKRLIDEKIEKERQKFIQKIKDAPDKEKVNFLAKYIIKQNSYEYSEEYKRIYRDDLFDLVCERIRIVARSKNPYKINKILLENGYFVGAFSTAFYECGTCKCLKHKDKFLLSKNHKKCADCRRAQEKISNENYKAKKYRKKLLISARERLRAKGFTKEMRTENIIEIQALILETKRKLKNRNHVNTNNEQEKNNDPCSHPAGRNSGIKRESRRSLIRYAKSAGSEGGE